VLRAVFFDMGGTLVSMEGTGDPWRPAVMEALEKEVGKRWWADALYDADIRRPPPNDPYRQETNRWLAEWLHEHGEPLTDEEVERVRRAFARPIPAGFGLTPGAAEAIRWCKERGMFVPVLTNTISRGDEEVTGDIKRLGLDGLVDLVVTSYTTGWEKPHPAMFQKALAAADIAAADACKVGDRLVVDVRGAQELGMRAVWIRPASGEPPTNITPDATIESLLELPAVLEAWSAG
jgi:FMN phosphatase YigB (HAD superfamily)